MDYVQDFEVIPFFENLLEPASPDEDRILDEYIATHGVDEEGPAIVWKEKNTLVDGHRRRRSCEKHNKRLPVARKAFGTKTQEEVAEWVRLKHAGTRSLTPAARRKLIAAHDAKAGKSKGGRPSRKTSATVAEVSEPQKSAEKLANQYGVSESTVAHDRQLNAALATLPNYMRSVCEAKDSPIAAKEVPALAAIEDNGQRSSVFKMLNEGEAKSVDAALHKLNGHAKKPAEPLDEGGKPIPKHLLKSFEVRTELRGLIQTIGKARERIEKMGEEPGGEFLSVVAIKTDLQNVRIALKAAVPHAVCPYCRGKKCKQCNSAGWLPKERYAGIPEEKR